MLVAINIGHGMPFQLGMPAYDPGAVAADGTHERKWCEALYDALRPLLKVPHVVIEDYYVNLPRRINEAGATFALSLHLNASENPTSNGTEVLHWHTSTRGAAEARRFAAAIARTLGTRLRHTGGALPRTLNDNGGGFLMKTAPVALILEPFFISNPTELATGTARRAQLARTIADCIHTIPR
jgi:N-acetylmuramoyl-L-alanine amidase